MWKREKSESERVWGEKGFGEMIAMQIFVKVGTRGKILGKVGARGKTGKRKWADGKQRQLRRKWKGTSWTSQTPELSSLSSWHTQPCIFLRTSMFDTNLQSDQHGYAARMPAPLKRQSSVTGCCLVEDLGATWLDIATGYPRSITAATDKTHISCSPVNDSFCSATAGVSQPVQLPTGAMLQVQIWAARS